MAAIMPSARTAAIRMASTSRREPEMISPSRISRMEFVSMMPGISSIMMPMRILSAWSCGPMRQNSRVEMPQQNEAMN